jgi:hypothetical protein
MRGALRVLLFKLKLKLSAQTSAKIGRLDRCPPAYDAHHQGHEEDNQEDVKQNLGNSGCCCRYTSESEKCGDERND